MPLSSPRRAVSLAEVALAAGILAVSVIPVIELIRSNIVALEITQVESVARSLGADVLERLCGPHLFGGDTFQSAVFGADTPWDLVVLPEPTLARGLPVEHLKALLARHRLTVRIDRELDLADPSWVTVKGFDRYTVTVRWTSDSGSPREIRLARLHARG